MPASKILVPRQCFLLMCPVLFEVFSLRPLDVCFLSFWVFAGIMATLESFVGRSCIPEDPQLRYVVPVEPKKSPADHPAVATKNKWTHAGHECSDSMALPMVADKKDRS